MRYDPKTKSIITTSNSGDARALLGSQEPAGVSDIVGKEPDLQGLCGRAWLSAHRGGAVVGLWIVEAPWAHPIWHSYAFSLVHLRPMEGMGPPILYRADATHEFLVYALNPEVGREACIRGEANPAIMEPCNFACQRAEASDMDACRTVLAAIDDVIEGKLSPDTDYLQTWAARFGAEMVKR